MFPVWGYRFPFSACRRMVPIFLSLRASRPSLLRIVPAGSPRDFSKAPTVQSLLVFRVPILPVLSPEYAFDRVKEHPHRPFSVCKSLVKGAVAIYPLYLFQRPGIAYGLHFFHKNIHFPFFHILPPVNICSFCAASNVLFASCSLLSAFLHLMRTIRF